MRLKTKMKVKITMMVTVMMKEKMDKSSKLHPSSVCGGGDV